MPRLSFYQAIANLSYRACNPRVTFSALRTSLDVLASARQVVVETRSLARQPTTASEF
jgi:hypothetical protein